MPCPWEACRRSVDRDSLSSISDGQSEHFECERKGEGCQLTFRHDSHPGSELVSRGTVRVGAFDEAPEMTGKIL